MKLADLDGTALSRIIATALEPDAPREALYAALLVEPLAMAQLAPDAPAGPAMRRPSGANVRLVEAPALRVPVVPLYVSHDALVAAAQDRGYWPDGIARGEVYEQAAAFAVLRGHPGALLVVDNARALALDAGEVAALADGASPDDYASTLRALVHKGRGREAVRILTRRPLYALGHPHGGLLLVERAIPVFLHLAHAERFADKVAAQSGEKAQHGLVGAADIFKSAFRGKMNVIIDPGPRSMTLRPADYK